MYISWGNFELTNSRLKMNTMKLTLDWSSSLSIFIQIKHSIYEQRIEVLNASKYGKLEHSNTIPTIPRVEFISQKLIIVIVALNASDLAILMNTMHLINLIRLILIWSCMINFGRNCSLYPESNLFTLFPFQSNVSLLAEASYFGRPNVNFDHS